MLMKTHRLIDNRDEARMLMKVKEIVARSSAGVIWNGISFEKMVIPTGGAYISTVFVGMYAAQAPLTRPPTSGTLSREGRGLGDSRNCHTSERAEDFERQRAGRARFFAQFILSVANGLCRNSARKSIRFTIADTVILSPGSFGTKDLHLSLLLKTHADPSLLLRMTV